MYYNNYGDAYLSSDDNIHINSYSYDYYQWRQFRYWRWQRPKQYENKCRRCELYNLLGECRRTS
jgi:hypothetical protein